jgi:hypothetical protein
MFLLLPLHHLAVRQVDFVRNLVRAVSAPPSRPVGSGVCRPGSFKLVVLALIWAYLHHLLAGRAPPVP